MRKLIPAAAAKLAFDFPARSAMLLIICLTTVRVMIHL